MPRFEIDLASVQQLPQTHRATIPAEYLDEMGHMNVMWYTHLFSLGMGGVLRMIGLDWKQIIDDQGGTFALESHVRYLSEIRVGQSIEVHARFIGRSAKRYHILLFMTNLDKRDVSATFEVIGAYVDLRVRRMAAFPESVADRLDQCIAGHNELAWAAPTCGVMRP